MTRYIRSFAGVCLAALLALTSLSAALARGQADPVGSLVICRGLTVVTIMVDAEGNPVETPHVCPDAALTLFVDSGVVAPDETVRQRLTPVRWGIEPAPAASWHAPGSQARGPPVRL